MKSKQGFASMKPEKRKLIASLGGRTAHLSGTAHQWNSEQARLAGAKGGRAKKKVGENGEKWKENPKP